jgi:hypothetical protein
MLSSEALKLVKFDFAIVEAFSIRSILNKKHAIFLNHASIYTFLRLLSDAKLNVSMRFASVNCKGKRKKVYLKPGLQAGLKTDPIKYPSDAIFCANMPESLFYRNNSRKMDKPTYTLVFQCKAPMLIAHRLEKLCAIKLKRVSRVLLIFG